MSSTLIPILVLLIFALIILFLLLDYQFIRLKREFTHHPGILSQQADPISVTSKIWIFPLLIGTISGCTLSGALFIYYFT